MQLPDHPDLDWYKRRARQLLKALRELDAGALARAEAVLTADSPRLEAVRGGAARLADAQWIVALEQGTASWPVLKRAIERVRAGSQEPFEQAAAAIRRGDANTLREVLAAAPQLLREVRDQGYSLLHIAASSDTLRLDNARQLVETLLDAGIEPDLRQPGTDTALHFAASLGHMPAIEALLAFGASTDLTDGVDRQADGGTPLVHALVYGCSRAADRLAEVEIAPLNLRVAAGLGRLDLMGAFFDASGGLLPEAGHHRAFYRPHSEFPEWTPGDSDQEILDEALCYATANARSDEVLGFLIDRGADPSGRPYDKSSLHDPALRGDRRTVEYLLDRGADPNVCDITYHSPAWGWARFGGHATLERRLLEVAARTHLGAAVESRSLEAVERRLEAGDEPQQTYPKGTPPLARALELGDVEIAEVLRRHGARLDLESAASLGDVDVVAGYLSAGADPQDALTAAVSNRQEDVVDQLLAAGARLQPHDAAALGRADVLIEALENGLEVDAVRSDGKTLLHRAIQGGRVDTVRLLLERGADVDLPSDGATCGPKAIHVAAMFAAPEAIFELLLEAGADINQGMNGGTPLDWALRGEDDATVEFLRALGAKTARELGDWPFN